MKNSQITDSPNAYIPPPPKPLLMPGEGVLFPMEPELDIPSLNLVDEPLPAPSPFQIGLEREDQFSYNAWGASFAVILLILFCIYLNLSMFI